MNDEIIIEPPDTLDIYTSDIKHCQTLNQSQEIWLGIALAAEKECKKLFNGVPKNKIELRFIKIQYNIKSTIESLDRRVVRLDGKTMPIYHLILHLVNETIKAKKEIVFSEKSLLCNLLNQLQPSFHKEILDLVIQLFLLPIETLKTYSSEIEGKIELPSPRRLIQTYNALVFKNNLDAIQRRASLAIDLLIRSQLGYVKWIAYKYRNLGLDYLDIIQEGNLGLMIAARKFDVYKNNSFKTFAVWWIKQRIQRSIADLSRTIRLPVYKYDEVRRLEKEYVLYQKKFGFDPSVDYLADICDVSIRKTKESLELLYPILSLEELEVCENNIRNSLNNENINKNITFCLRCELLEDYLKYNNTFMVPQKKAVLLCWQKDLEFSYTPNGTYLEGVYDMLKDESFKDLAENIFDDQLEIELKKILSRFSDRDQEIIYIRYGLSSDESKTLEEVAKIYELTRERIRQIEYRIFETLRKPKSAKILQAFLPPFD